MIINQPTETLAGCIDIYDNVIDNCEEIIDLSESMGRWCEAEVSEGNMTNVVHGIKNNEVRSNLVFPINQFSYLEDQKFIDVAKTTWFYCNAYALKYGFKFSSTELCSILKYRPGDFFKEHHDDGGLSPRIFSAILYLNDVEVGGETYFSYFGVKVKPKAGRLVIFPANYAYRHAALPPESNDKYAVVFWMTP